MSVGPIEISDDVLISMIRSPAASDKRVAWTYVYKRCYPVIKSLIVRSQGTKDDARDIFQEGLAVVHNNIVEGIFKEKSTIQTYLYSICRNLWMRELRRREKGRTTVREMIEELKLDLNSYLIDVEIVGVLMTELHEDCRRILIEFYFNSRSMEELKVMFSVNSVQAAKNKKWRCLNYLKRLFESKSIIPFSDQNNEQAP